jgi:hypothetical protein
VTGRNRTCAAPRFRRALYRLSYGHVKASLATPTWRWCRTCRRRRRIGGAGVEPAVSCVSDRCSPAELSAFASAQSWSRTSNLLFVRQAPSQLGHPRGSKLRDKGSNLDLQVQSLASFRLDDPGSKWALAPRAPTTSVEAVRALRPSPVPEIDAERHSWLYDTVCTNATDVFQASRLPFGPGSTGAAVRAAGPASDVEGRWSPALLRVCAEGPFSLRRGLDSELALVQAEHHPFSFRL